MIIESFYCWTKIMQPTRGRAGFQFLRLQSLEDSVCTAIAVPPTPIFFFFFTSKKNRSVLHFLTVSCVVGINGLGWFGSRYLGLENFLLLIVNSSQVCGILFCFLKYYATRSIVVILRNIIWVTLYFFCKKQISLKLVLNIDVLDHFICG